MDSLQNLKKRLKSIGNIKKITKAMELVAATKMRKSQEIALASRPYAFSALGLLANLSLLKKDVPLLMEKKKVKKVLFVLVASDKGLAGAFNSSVFKKFEHFLAENSKKYQDEKIFVAVGEKTFNYLSKKGLKVAKKFTNVGDYTTPEHVQPLVDFLVQGYVAKEWDKVIIFSANFRSALKQEPLTREVLPILFESIWQGVKEIVPETGKFAQMAKEQGISFVPQKNVLQEYLIEPSAKEVLDNLVRHLLFMQVYHIILEANASEHAARRMAMKTASDNASDLGQELNLRYNKSRQSAITNQIIEIIAGAESLS